jgi:charged multivesicular body protein 2A
MNLPEIQKIMMEFEKQSEIMDMKEEMMDDAIDDALGDENDEVEGLVKHKIYNFVFFVFILKNNSDKIVTQVLDELGIELTGELASNFTFYSFFHFFFFC